MENHVIDTEKQHLKIQAKHLKLREFNAKKLRKPYQLLSNALFTTHKRLQFSVFVTIFI